MWIVTPGGIKQTKKKSTKKRRKESASQAQTSPQLIIHGWLAQRSSIKKKKKKKKKTNSFEDFCQTLKGPTHTVSLGSSFILGEARKNRGSQIKNLKK